MAALATRSIVLAEKPASPFALSSLAKFVDPLPVPEIAKAMGTRPSPEDPKRQLPFYRLAMREMKAKVHRDLPTTRMWAFGGSSPGPTIEARSGEGILVEWANELPKQHFLPIDHSVHGAESTKPDVRVVTELGWVEPVRDAADVVCQTLAAGCGEDDGA